MKLTLKNLSFSSLLFVFLILGMVNLVAELDAKNKTEPVIEEKAHLSLSEALEQGRTLAIGGKATEALPFLRQAADEGSVEGQQLCALILIKLKSPLFFDEAEERLQKAVEMGSVLALEEQARLALDGGLGRAPDFEKAKELLEKAKDLPGARECFYLLGKMAAEGLGRERDLTMAVSFLRRGEEAGSVSSLVGLADLYLGEGALIERDLPQAEQLLTRAFALKSGEAAFRLGMIEERLRGEDPDLMKARDWFVKGSELGDGASFKKLGDYALEQIGSEENEAFGLYQTAAVLENADAAYALALLYHQGRVVEKDAVASSAWMRIAADRGQLYAQNELGIRLLNGLGVASDFDQAVTFLEQSAEKGYPPAQFNLGVVLLETESEPEKLERAFTLLEKAAKAGHLESAVQLARLYTRGTVREKDLSNAAYWASRASVDPRFEKLALEAKSVLNEQQKAELESRLKKL